MRPTLLAAALLCGTLYPAAAVRGDLGLLEVTRANCEQVRQQLAVSVTPDPADPARLTVYLSGAVAGLPVPAASFKDDPARPQIEAPLRVVVDAAQRARRGETGLIWSTRVVLSRDALSRAVVEVVIDQPGTNVGTCYRVVLSEFLPPAK